MEPMCCILKTGLLVRFKNGTNAVILRIGLLVRFKNGTNVLYT